jgi:hypothetical protein
MRQLKQSILKLPNSLDAGQTLKQVEAEVNKYWEQGWVFVKAEPDSVFESVCLYFEREIHAE